MAHEIESNTKNATPPLYRPDNFIFFKVTPFATDPKSDGIGRFSAVRTDEDLNITDEVSILCKPPSDRFPNPLACAVFGLSPFEAEASGLRETEFYRKIAVFMLKEPPTCCIGYNNMKVDDEFLRFGFWRNLVDPYYREWIGGNSRWDARVLTGLVADLRPGKINWPGQDGTPEFNLYSLLDANKIDYDKNGNIARHILDWVRFLKAKKPNLFEFACGLHRKHEAAKWLGQAGRQTLIVPRRGGDAKLSVVASLGSMPSNNREFALFNLDADPKQVKRLSGMTEDKIADWKRESDDNHVAFPFFTVQAAHCNAFAPFEALRSEDAARLGIDMGRVKENIVLLNAMVGSNAAARLKKTLEGMERDLFAALKEDDPDRSLYNNFLSDPDKCELVRLASLAPGSMSAAKPQFSLFDSARLKPLWLRFRARNYHSVNGALTRQEKERWANHLSDTLLTPNEEGNSPLKDFTNKAIGTVNEMTAFNEVFASRFEKHIDDRPKAIEIAQAIKKRATELSVAVKQMGVSALTENVWGENFLDINEEKTLDDTNIFEQRP